MELCKKYNSILKPKRPGPTFSVRIPEVSGTPRVTFTPRTSGASHTHTWGPSVDSSGFVNWNTEPHTLVLDGEVTMSSISYDPPVPNGVLRLTEESTIEMHRDGEWIEVNISENLSGEVPEV